MEARRRKSSVTSKSKGSRASAFDHISMVEESRMPSLSLADQPATPTKRNKSERSKLQHSVQTQKVLQRKVGRGGSLSSNECSTLSSTASSPSLSTLGISDVRLLALVADAGSPPWSVSWIKDKVGSAPGELRVPEGVCVSRNSGHVILADSKNARLQVLSGSTGRLISVLGAEGPDQRIASMFSRMSLRRMQPFGLCENLDGSLLFVTDLNRVLILDGTTTRYQGSNFEVMIPGKTNLSGVAVTDGDKMILSEANGTKSSVGLYENNGVLLRSFDGDFRSPTYVAWNEEYELLAVSDGELQCVSLYNASGKCLNKFGRPPTPYSTSSMTSSMGLVEVPFGLPAGVCWMGGTRLLVADRAEHRIVAIDIRNFTIEDLLTNSFDGLCHPVAIATNGRNQIALTEQFYDFKVNKFKLKMFTLTSPLEALQF